jgi:hypothetical protein
MSILKDLNLNTKNPEKFTKNTGKEDGNSISLYTTTKRAETEMCSNYETNQCRNRMETMYKQTNKQTPWPLVRERTILTERPPLDDEI